MSRWKTLWQTRTLPSESDSVLRTLMAADGFESGFAGMTVEAWADGVRYIASQVRLAPGESVFDVGCGAGAWLYPLASGGHPVGGLDLSPALISKAAEVLPGGDFVVAEATELSTEPAYDLVLGGASFLYFPSLEYAATTVDLMVAKTRRAIALLDLPDLATREADLARRHHLAGGREQYAARYEGLDHRYYEREWVRDALLARGLVDVHIEQQSTEGYGNAPFRFNAWGFVKP